MGYYLNYDRRFFLPYTTVLFLVTRILPYTRTFTRFVRAGSYQGVVQGSRTVRRYGYCQKGPQLLKHFHLTEDKTRRPGRVRIYGILSLLPYSSVRIYGTVPYHSTTVLVLESYGPNFTCFIRVFSTIQYAPVHRTKKALMAPRRGRVPYEPQASTSTPTSTRSTAE